MRDFHLPVEPLQPPVPQPSHETASPKVAKQPLAGKIVSSSGVGKGTADTSSVAKNTLSQHPSSSTKAMSELHTVSTASPKSQPQGIIDRIIAAINRLFSPYSDQDLKNAKEAFTDSVHKFSQLNNPEEVTKFINVKYKAFELAFGKEQAVKLFDEVIQVSCSQDKEVWKNVWLPFFTRGILDFPQSSPEEIVKFIKDQYKSLENAFGTEQAVKLLSEVVEDSCMKNKAIWQTAWLYFFKNDFKEKSGLQLTPIDLENMASTSTSTPEMFQKCGKKIKAHVANDPIFQMYAEYAKPAAKADAEKEKREVPRDFDKKFDEAFQRQSVMVCLLEALRNIALGGDAEARCLEFGEITMAWGSGNLDNPEKLQDIALEDKQKAKEILDNMVTTLFKPK